MKPRTILLLVVTAIVTAFVILNRHQFVQPTTLSLGFREVEAPLGLVMLGFTVLITTALIGYADHLRKAALVQAGISAKELQAQRRLADQAEASRFTDLRQFLEAEFKQHSEEESAFRTDLNARLEAIDRQLQACPRPAPPRRD